METSKHTEEVKTCKQGVWVIDDAMYSRLTVTQCLRLMLIFQKNISTLKTITEVCQEEPKYYRKDLLEEYRKFREELLQLELSIFDDIFSS